MQPRMTHPTLSVPGAFYALQALSRAASQSGLPERTNLLIMLRASQINGCTFCTEMHTREARSNGEAEERLATVAAWRDAPYFSAAERAALALTEAVTRLSDRPDPVPDVVFDEAARHYDEPALAALLLSIAVVNVWNRLNVAIRQPSVTGAVSGPSDLDAIPPAGPHRPVRRLPRGSDRRARCGGRTPR